MVANIVAYELRTVRVAAPTHRFQSRVADGDRELAMSDALELGE
jgi:hypothetical protein